MKRTGKPDFKIRPEVLSLKPYVPGKPIDEVRRELGIDRVYKLASNELPYGPVEKVREAIYKAASEIHRYPDSNNYYLLKEISNKFSVPEEKIVFGNGSSELIKLIADCVVTEGDCVVYGDPSFVMYPIVSQGRGARIREIPLKGKNLSHDLNEMLSVVNGSTSMVIICNPNNPTGTITPTEEIEIFLEKVPDEILVVIDEAYAEFVSEKNFKSGVDFFHEGWQNLCVLRSFSKAYGLAGLRVGYGFVPEDLADAVNRVREPFNINLIAQEAALAALDSEDEYVEIRSRVIKERERVTRILAENGFFVPESHANFIFFDTHVDSDILFKEILKEGVIVRTGSIFGEKYKNYIRVTIGTSYENDLFLEKFFELSKELRKGGARL